MNATTHTNEGKEEQSRSSVSKMIKICLLSIACGVLYFMHIQYMHESNVMFSHLTEIEREMFFRTEAGFYYSFYKQLINSGDDYGQLQSIYRLLIKDNLTEFPTEINALQRFNLYPEIVLARLYRIFKVITQGLLGVKTTTCYIVNREGLPNGKNCDGIGDPAVFYVTLILVLHGVMMSVLALLGYILSGRRLLGAMVVFLMFMFNHRECTRVQWSAPLRENFSFPFIIIQQTFLIFILQQKNSKYVSSINRAGFIITTLYSLLAWQFAQFALLTQTIALFLSYLIGSSFQGKDDAEVTSIKSGIKTIYYGLLVADVLNVILQMGNSLLLIGPFRPCYLICLLLISIEPIKFCQFKSRFLIITRWIVMFVSMVLLTLALKCGISFVLSSILSSNMANNMDDDGGHMIEILRSKFSNFQSFDSLIYTCAAEFDFYDVSSLKELIKTGLLPLAGVVFISIPIATIYFLFKNQSNTNISQQDSNLNSGGCKSADSFYDVPVYYIFFQTCAYTMMAMLIMRLKLFFTPQLCIIASLAFSRKFPLNKFLDQRFSQMKIAPSTLLHILIFSLVAKSGYHNLKAEWQLMGAYSNWEQEQLLNYIINQTPKNASFTGKMPTMATVRLATGRPITMHPHYEHTEARRRVKMAYSIYSKKSLNEVHSLLRQLHTDYLVYEPGFCTYKSGNSNPKCSYFHMWDLLDTENSPRQPVCFLFDSMIRGGGSATDQEVIQRLFRPVYLTEQSQYAVFKVL